MQICLVGAGHAHILLLKRLTKVLTPGIQWVFINPYPHFYYTGQWTSVLSGEKNLSSVEVPLHPLVQQIQAIGNHISFRIDEAFDLNPRAKSLRFRHAGEVLMETVSFNIAGESLYPQLVPLKPIQIPTQLLEAQDYSRIQIVGGGAVGVESALCMAARFRRTMAQTKRHIQIQLVEKGGCLLSAAPRSLQKKCLDLLGQAGVDVVFRKDFMDFPADIRFSAVPQQAQKWLRDSGLRQAGKYLAINAQLETSTPGIFAVGEGTLNPELPTPQNGIVSVRQSDILFHNLLHRSGFEASSLKYNPQEHFLVLMNSGEGTALGYRGNFNLGHSKFNLWLKNKIDERFMNQFRKT